MSTMSDKEKIQIRVLFFAAIKEITNTGLVEFIVPMGTTVGELKLELSSRYPALETISSHMLASINQEFAFDDDIIPSDAEIAFFPAVSGGENYPTIVKIVTDSFSTDELIRQITFRETGAVCSFTGIIRGITAGAQQVETMYLEYEAYVPMAEAKMMQVAAEIRAQWPSVQGIILVQRIGKLASETPTVLIACSAAHRNTGVFDAAKYGIDRLKEIVPIWKKEIGPQGNVWVEGEYIPNRGD